MNAEEKAVIQNMFKEGQIWIDPTNRTTYTILEELGPKKNRGGWNDFKVLVKSHGDKKGAIWTLTAIRMHNRHLQLKSK